MNVVSGSTANEQYMIKQIQAAIGANQDGQIGTQTMSDLAVKVGAKCFPLTLQIYGAPVIIANDLLVVGNPGTGLASYANSMNGSFYANLSNKNVPCSICISHGNVIREYACHLENGYPESVLYRLTNGTYGLVRVKTASELPAGVSWAVGGMGLLQNYSPSAEGFVGAFSDVLRVTNHAMLGVKNNKVYMVYCANMGSDGINNLAKTLGLQYALQLDGGHIAGMNGSEGFAKINTSITQIYLLQGI
jgi:hypothetical protein